MRYLLLPVRFQPIDFAADWEEVQSVAFSYGKKAEIDFEPLSNNDFFERLCYACANRWGLVIELIIEALTLCKSAGEKYISLDHFVDAYAETHGMSREFSPFTASDYREQFDPDRLLELLNEDS